MCTNRVYRVQSECVGLKSQEARFPALAVIYFELQNLKNFNIHCCVVDDHSSNFCHTIHLKELE